MLKRGFLINRNNVILNDKKKIWMAFAIGVGYSLLFYLFTVCLREYIRYLSVLADQNFMLVLTSKENFFYNFFFAALATMAGVSFGVDSIIKTQFHLPGYVRHSISNDCSGLLWISIYWISKLGMIFGLMISSIGISTEFSFFEDYWYMFPLFFFVLFFNQWIKFRLFIKKNSFKIMLYSFIGLISYSVILASIPIINYKSFNHSVLKNTINYNYTIDLPEADFNDPVMPKYLVREIYFGAPKKEGADSVVLAIKGISHPVSKNEFSAWLKNEMELLDPYDVHELTIALNSDKSVSMASIKAVFRILQEQDTRRLILVTSGYKAGLSFVLAPLCKEIKLDTSYSQPSCLEYPDLKKFRAKNVHLKNDSITIDSRYFKLSDFAEELKRHIENNKSNYIINLRIDNSSSYQTFISLMDIFNKTIVSLREKMALKQFSKKYDHTNTRRDDQKLYDTLANTYPMNFIMRGDAKWEFY